MTNCDEVFYLDGSVDMYGNPDKKLDEMVKEMGVGGVYAYHINRLADILKGYGKRPMIWADSDKVTAPPQWGTGPEKTAFGGHRDEALAKMSKDVVLVAWEYEPYNDFFSYLKPLADSGREVFVAPGTSSWGQIFPQTPKATVNIFNFVRDGAAVGAKGMLLTTWDDDGEAFMGYQWYPLAWGAECCWKPSARGADSNEVREREVKSFDSAYPAVFYGFKANEADSETLQLLDIRRNPVHKTSPMYGLGVTYFWMNAADSEQQGKEDGDIKRQISDAGQIVRKLDKAKSVARYHAGNLEFTIFAARRCEFMARRILAVRNMKAAGGNAEFTAKAGNAFEELSKEAESLKLEYKRLWEVEARPSSLEVVLGRYDKLIEEMKQNRPSQSEGDP